MSVRDKLVELAYIRWELRQRVSVERPTVVRPPAPPWPTHPPARVGVRR